jgi:hypothetical protein
MIFFDYSFAAMILSVIVFQVFSVRIKAQMVCEKCGSDLIKSASRFVEYNLVNNCCTVCGKDIR